MPIYYEKLRNVSQKKVSHRGEKSPRMQLEKRRQDKIRAVQKSNMRREKARKERLLKRWRAEQLMKNNFRQCQPEFRIIVMRWARNKTTARVNLFFRQLKQFHCPMEPCYNTKRLSKVLRLLRKNKCGRDKLNYGLHLPDIVSGWNKHYEKKFHEAHELYIVLQNMADDYTYL